MCFGQAVSACATILDFERERAGSEPASGGDSGRGGPAGGVAGSAGLPEVSGTTELVELELSDGELSPPFDSARRDYALRLPLGVAELEVTARTADPNATLLVDGRRSTSGEPSHRIPIPLGVFELVVSVETSAGAEDSYRIMVERALELTVPGYVKASPPHAEDRFGHSLAISGITLAIGVPDHDGGSTGTEPQPGSPDAEDSGAVYLFRRSAKAWEQVLLLKAGNTDPGDGFGHSLAISGDTLVVGAPFEDSASTRIDGDQHDNSAPDSGAVFVFRRSVHAWVQEAYLKAHNAEAGDRFGFSVALDGARIVVGAPLEDSPEIGTDGNGDRNDKGDSGAAYVFEHDGLRWGQHAYVKPSNTGEGDRFGHSLALSGATFAVGAPYEDSTARGVGGKQNDDDAFESGAAYIFVLEPNTGAWRQQAYVKAGTTQAFSHFGWSVALFGDTFAGGAPFESSNATGIDGNPQDTSAAESGAVYVYTRDGTGWANPVYLKASNTEAGDRFGGTVALFGDLLAVGARGEDGAARGLQGNQFDNRASGSGALYLFSRVDEQWTPPQYIKASNTGEQDGFGQGVAVSSRFIAVGADYEDGGAEGGEPEEDSGAVYVLDIVGSEVSDPGDRETSVREKPAPALDSGLLDETVLSEAVNSSVAHFGIRLALSSETLAVSRPDPIGGGKVYVFEHDGSKWRLRSTLSVTGEEGLSAFGSSVAVSRDTLAVGAGSAVFTYARSPAGWSRDGTIQNPYPIQEPLFGASIALSDDTLVVGDPSALDLETGEMIGAVYVFARAAGVWSEPLRLEASNQGKDDAFGASVALFGDVLAVGAPWEDSGAAGIDGDRGDNGSFDSGAVYVFMRSGSTWVERAYLKAHNSDWHDEFGTSVALFGDLLVVGAPYEDGNGVGVGGDPYNDLAQNSGAVYAFKLEEGAIYPDGYIKAINSDSNDHFGYQVALTGDRLAVAAINEDGGSRRLDRGWDDNSAESSGAVHLFQRSQERWLEKGYVKASNAAAGQLFGLDVALSNRSLAVATHYGEVLLREVFVP